jgi:hypothetical protein
LTILVVAAATELAALAGMLIVDSIYWILGG